MGIRALDVHAHPGTKETRASLGRYFDGMEKYYHHKMPVKTDEEMVEDFRKDNVKVLLVAWDAETVSGLPKTPNDYIASLVKRFPDVFPNGWASVDPWKGEVAIMEIERAIKELGLVGVKFQQAIQAFFPNDRRFYPLWEKCVELGVAVQFHVGTTGIGGGPPGGSGVHLKYTQPIYIDDVAADFPNLKISCLHPAWPWQDEMLAILQHKGNVYNELSGWSPKYFPPQLKKEINGRLQDKFLFGSDYPAMLPSRWLNDFESEGYKPEVIEKVFYKNALRLFGDKLPKDIME